MKKLIMTLAAVLLCGTAGAQENDSTVCAQQNDSVNIGRKKVAVVLSGGGAKGMAHIGVLKVL